MAIDVLASFGALECRYRQVPLGKAAIPRLVAFNMTPWGKAVLNAVAATDELQSQEGKLIGGAC